MAHLSLQTSQLLQGARRCFVGSGAQNELGLVRWLQGWHLAEQRITSVLHSTKVNPCALFAKQEVMLMFDLIASMSPLPLLTLSLMG